MDRTVRFEKMAFSDRYSRLDRSEILRFLFYPRPEEDWEAHRPEGVEEVTIPVAPGIRLGGRFFFSRPGAPAILFFHGNGEIVADYTDLGQVYQSMGIHFMPVDYRGYGRSSGTPTISAMLHDAHSVLEFSLNRLRQSREQGPLIVMGRSLGSGPALELAAAYGEWVDGLIIESGFSRTGPLLERLGLPREMLDVEEEEDGLDHLGKIGRFRKETLVIHGQEDEIIPFQDGLELYEASGASQKRLLRIPGAGHNDLLLRAAREYLQAIQELVDSVLAKTRVRAA